MALDGTVAWAVGLLVVAIIVINVVIPTTINETADMVVTGTVTGESYNATANTAYALNYHPLVDITDNRLSTFATINNVTNIGGNASNNVTRTYTLSTPIDSGAVSGRGYNFSYQVIVGAGSNISVWVGSTNIATVSANNSYTAVGRLTSELSASTVVTFVFNGANVSNVTSANLTYPYFAAHTGYTENLGAGTVTPNTTGTYYTSYQYGTTGTTQAQTILLIIPLLLAVILLYLAISPVM